MKEIASYLVRIYRREGGMHAGVVEQVRTGRTAAFASLADLVDLLGGRRRFARRPAPAPTPGPVPPSSVPDQETT